MSLCGIYNIKHLQFVMIADLDQVRRQKENGEKKYGGMPRKKVLLLLVGGLGSTFLFLVLLCWTLMQGCCLLNGISSVSKYLKVPLTSSRWMLLPASLPPPAYLGLDNTMLWKGSVEKLKTKPRIDASYR